MSFWRQRHYNHDSLVIGLHDARWSRGLDGILTAVSGQTPRPATNRHFAVVSRWGGTMKRFGIVLVNFSDGPEDAKDGFHPGF